MNKKPLILGIESSCDETAASIITENEQGMPIILSNIVSSQVDVHKEFGGVVPELAARSHMEKIDLITKKAIDESGVKMEDIDAIAATAGPGLIVCLSVGLSFGKAMACSLDKPFIAVNHLEGHALSPKLNSELNYPYLLLLISGGHTQFLSVQGLGNYKRLGTTIDDAVGEAFDKTAKMLGLPYPGGPVLAALAEHGTHGKYEFPRPMTNRPGLDFSFSGLKTFSMNTWLNSKKTDQDRADIALAFQNAAVETLAIKCKRAMKQTGYSTLVIAGGVSANKALRVSLNNIKEIQTYYPRQEFCSDNGAMIAFTGAMRQRSMIKTSTAPSFSVRPRWPLEELTPPSPV